MLKVFKKCFYPEFQKLANDVYHTNLIHFDRPKRRVCVYTNRQRAVLSISRSSRHRLRSSLGFAYGFRKSSW